MHKLKKVALQILVCFHTHFKKERRKKDTDLRCHKSKAQKKEVWNHSRLYKQAITKISVSVFKKGNLIKAPKLLERSELFQQLPTN